MSAKDLEELMDPMNLNSDPYALPNITIAVFDSYQSMALSFNMLPDVKLKTMYKLQNLEHPPSTVHSPPVVIDVLDHATLSISFDIPSGFKQCLSSISSSIEEPKSRRPSFECPCRRCHNSLTTR